MSELTSWAHRYADAGISVFPLRTRSKSPAIAAAHPEGDPQRGVCRGECGAKGHGLYDAVTDHVQIGRWWRRWPTANIGVPCGPSSGWLAVDLDGDAGEASWARLEAEHGQVVTVVISTGRGRHLIFAWPEDCTLGNSSGLLGPRIDTRGIGGFVVAAPSTHPTGVAYRHWDQPGVYTPQKPPTWLLAALHTPPAAAPRPKTTGGAYVDRETTSDLPRHLQRLAGTTPARRGRGAYHLIATAIEWGLGDSDILDLAATHQPTTDKYGTGDRLVLEVNRIIGKLRPDHRHVGRPCDVADCPRKPRWMVTS